MANDTPPICPKCRRGPMASCFGIEGPYEVCVEDGCDYVSVELGTRCFVSLGESSTEEGLR